MAKIIWLLLFAPAVCAAGPESGTATAHLAFRIVIPPIVKLLGCTATAGGRECRFWTNKRELTISGKHFRLDAPGELTVVLAAQDEIVLVHGL